MEQSQPHTDMPDQFDAEAYLAEQPHAVQAVEIQVDSRRRAYLGRLGELHDRYRVYEGSEGRLVLVPVVSLTIHEYEALLPSTPEA